jgi:hypothetical protein
MEENNMAYNLKKAYMNGPEELIKKEINAKYDLMKNLTIKNGQTDFSLAFLNETMCNRMQEYLKKKQHNQYGTVYLNKYEISRDRPHFETEIEQVCELRYKIN